MEHKVSEKLLEDPSERPGLIARSLEQEKGRERLEAKWERPGLRVREAEEELGLHPWGD